MATLQDQHVTGTMQLLAACQTSEYIRRVVVASTTAVYGAGSGDPAVFTEDMRASDSPSGDYARDAVEVESYVRGFIRRRPDIAVSVLRLASLMGPTVDTALTRYLSMPIVPTSLGYDPRLQLLHEWDAVEALVRACGNEHRGVVNVAGDGVVSLAQAVRRAGRLRLPVPALGDRGARRRRSAQQRRRRGVVGEDELLELRAGRGHDAATQRVRLSARATTPRPRCASYIDSGDRRCSPPVARLARRAGIHLGGAGTLERLASAPRRWAPEMDEDR